MLLPIVQRRRLAGVSLQKCAGMAARIFLVAVAIRQTDADKLRTNANGTERAR